MERAVRTLNTRQQGTSSFGRWQLELDWAGLDHSRDNITMSPGNALLLPRLAAALMVGPARTTKKKRHVKRDERGR